MQETLVDRLAGVAQQGLGLVAKQLLDPSDSLMCGDSHGHPLLSSNIDAVKCRPGTAPRDQYSLPVKWRSLLSWWRASIRRTVPERERITIESVIAPSVT